MSKWATLGDITLNHLDGVPWHRAPLPRRWHRCKPQTWGSVGFEPIERCACGALRYGGGPWIERNQTRKARREAS